MRFSLDTDSNKYSIKSYGPGWVNVNERELRRSLIITPERLITDWPPQCLAELDETHIATVCKVQLPWPESWPRPAAARDFSRSTAPPPPAVPPASECCRCGRRRRYS